MAIGGYGRAELNPLSDIDFMFLHDGQVVAGKPLPHLAKLIDGILYPLWDLGLKVGHSVRSIEDCVGVANTDMQSKTSLIEARLITGSERLFKKFQKIVVTKCVASYVEKYIAARLEDQAARHAKFGNSASMQEPNIKNGCGGLRDYQNLLWMAFFKYRTRSLPELQAQEFVSPAERKQLEAAYDFLLRVRTELHYQILRPQDVLGKNLQPAIAHNLGYARPFAQQAHREIHARRLHAHAQHLSHHAHAGAAHGAAPGRRPAGSRCAPGCPGAAWSRRRWTASNSSMAKSTPSRSRIFRDSPRRLMRVFLHAQQRGCGCIPTSRS